MFQGKLVLSQRVLNLGKWLSDFRNLCIVFFSYMVLTTLFRPVLNWFLLSFSKYFMGPSFDINKHLSNDIPGVYPIYRNAFFNLINQKDLYLPDSALDYFLYTPTFALLMAPCAVLPDIIGSLLWNAINLAFMLIAIKMLPLKDFSKLVVMWMIFMPAMNNIQHFQSNVLVTALILLAFAMFEKDKVVWAGIFLVFGFFVKVYVIGFAVVFLFYPNKLRFLAGVALSFIVFAAMPLVAVPWDHLLFLYGQWVKSLALDTSCNINFMGVLRGLFDIHVDPVHIQLCSMLFLFMPLFRLKQYKEISFRVYYLVLLMVWVVIFSHKSESPSYVVALGGIAIWFAVQKEYSTLKIFLLLFLFLFTYLSTTDVFPGIIRKYFFLYCGIKAVPCIFIFLVLFYELMVFKFANLTDKLKCGGDKCLK